MRPGYTVMEMVVAMSIVAVLMAVAGPRVDNYLERDRVRTLNRRLTTDLAMARSEAIRKKAPVTITFDPSGEFYEIRGVDGMRTPDGVQGDTYRVNLKGKRGYDALIEEADFEGSNSLSYDAFGRASADGTIRVSNGDADGTIQIRKSTGASVTIATPSIPGGTGGGGTGGTGTGGTGTGGGGGGGDPPPPSEPVGGGTNSLTTPSGGESQSQSGGFFSWLLGGN